MEATARRPIFLPGFMFNLAFAAAAVAIQNLLSAGLASSLEARGSSPALALFVFAAGMADGVALRPKLRAVQARSAEGRLSPNTITAVFLAPLVIRLLLGLVLAAAVGTLLAPALREMAFSTYAGLALAILLVVKELYVLFGSLILLLKPRPKILSRGRELLCDASLLAYGCAAYTVLTYRGFFLTRQPSRDPVTLGFIVLLFTLAVMSIRTAHLLDEFLGSGGRAGRIAAPCSTLAAGVAAAWPFFS